MYRLLISVTLKVSNLRCFQNNWQRQLILVSWQCDVVALKYFVSNFASIEKSIADQIAVVRHRHIISLPQMRLHQQNCPKICSVVLFDDMFVKHHFTSICHCTSVSSH